MVLRARSRIGANAPTIGFLVDLLEDGYQSAVAQGISKAAKNAGATVLCFVGGILGSEERAAPQRNHVFALANPTTVDALIVLGGTLVNHIGKEALAEYCSRYRPIPMCSIGAPLSGMPNVLIDNDAGMRSVVEHLIVVHGFKRIAFVRGPLANVEAEMRYQIYCDVLTKHAMALDERLVVVGNFQIESGRAAVACLLDERHIDPKTIDAIVVSNDNMAFGVLEALGARGIRVPADIAVTGFDDVEEARYVSPGLTTVRQPLEEQGHEAVRLVMLSLQQRVAPSNLLLRTELVTRGSCGCMGIIEHAPPSSAAAFQLGFEAMLVSRRQRVLAELARAARGGLTHAGANWEARLVSTVAEELRGEKIGTTVKLFEGMVVGLVERGSDIAVCHDVLDCLRNEMLACLHKEPERRATAEDLFQDIRLVIGKTVERLLGGNRLRLQHWARQLSTVGANLIGTFDLVELHSAVAANFPLLGIASCHIVTYAGDQRPSDLGRLVLSYDSHAGQEPPSNREFATGELLPSEVMRNSHQLRNFVVAAVFFKHEVMGYVLFEFDVALTFAYEAIRDLISAALMGAKLVEDIRLRQQQLDLATRANRDDRNQMHSCRTEMQQLVQDISEGRLTDGETIRQRVLGLLAHFSG